MPDATNTPPPPGVPAGARLMARMRRDFDADLVDGLYTAMVWYTGALAATALLTAKEDDPNQEQGRKAFEDLRTQFRGAFGVEVGIDLGQRGHLTAAAARFRTGHETAASPEAVLARRVAEGIVAMAERTRRHLAEVGDADYSPILLDAVVDLPARAAAEQLSAALGTVAVGLTAATRPAQAATAALFMDAYRLPHERESRPHAGWGLGFGPPVPPPEPGLPAADPKELASARIRVGRDVRGPLRGPGRGETQDRLADAMRLVTDLSGARVVGLGDGGEDMVRSVGAGLGDQSFYERAIRRALPIGLIAKATAVAARSFYSGHFAYRGYPVRDEPAFFGIGPGGPSGGDLGPDVPGVGMYLTAPASLLYRGPYLRRERSDGLASLAAAAAPWSATAAAITDYELVLRKADPATAAGLRDFARYHRGERPTAAQLESMSTVGSRLERRARAARSHGAAFPAATGLSPLTPGASRAPAGRMEPGAASDSTDMGLRQGPLHDPARDQRDNGIGD